MLGAKRTLLKISYIQTAKQFEKAENTNKAKNKSSGKHNNFLTTCTTETNTFQYWNANQSHKSFNFFTNLGFVDAMLIWFRDRHCQVVWL